MELFLDQVVNGLTAGSEYALIAAGLALIFGVVEIVNFAQGELYMIGAYFLYIAQSFLDLPYGLALLVELVMMALLGVLFYVVVIRRILNRGWQVQLVATLAVSILLVNVAIVTAGALPKTVNSSLTYQIVEIGSLRLSVQRILVLATAVAAFAALASFLKYTKTGRAMRAVAQNREAAAVVGVPIQRIGLVAVVVASLFCGLASGTIAPLHNVEPTMGMIVIIKAFAAVIMGGFGNVTGAVVSAFFLGLTEAFAIGYISSAYADAIVFGVMIVVLLVKPNGIFGKAVRA
jgi:branched-chain amino acid transport system permease protein